MKEILIYITGGLLWLPVMCALCTDSITVSLFGLIWGVFLWHSPKISPKAKRFWRTFHKVNNRLTNDIFK